MISGICDMHCHILPGLDDGVQSVDEAILCLETAVRQGIRSIIVTPHYYPIRYETDVSSVRNAVREMQEICRSLNLPLELYAGMECFYYSGLLEKLQKGEVLTLAESRCVLVEFSPESLYSQIFAGVSELMRGGYIPVLAHFERYECLRDIQRLEELKRIGVMLQMNFDTLLERHGLFGHSPWRKMVRSGAVDLFGSDCHGMNFRPYRVEQAFKWLEKNLDPQLRKRILEENTKKLCNKN